MQELQAAGNVQQAQQQGLLQPGPGEGEPTLVACGEQPEQCAAATKQAMHHNAASHWSATDPAMFHQLRTRSRSGGFADLKSPWTIASCSEPRSAYSDTIHACSQQRMCSGWLDCSLSGQWTTKMGSTEGPESTASHHTAARPPAACLLLQPRRTVAPPGGCPASPRTCLAPARHRRPPPPPAHCGPSASAPPCRRPARWGPCCCRRCCRCCELAPRPLPPLPQRQSARRLLQVARRPGCAPRTFCSCSRCWDAAAARCGRGRGQHVATCGRRCDGCGTEWTAQGRFWEVQLAAGF